MIHIQKALSFVLQTNTYNILYQLILHFYVNFNNISTKRFNITLLTAYDILKLLYLSLFNIKKIIITYGVAPRIIYIHIIHKKVEQNIFLTSYKLDSLLCHKIQTTSVTLSL